MFNASEELSTDDTGRLTGPSSVVKPALLILAALVGAAALAHWTAPAFDDVVRAALGSDRVLLSSDGQILQTLRTDYKKRRLPWQPLSTFPGTVRAAVLEAEDKRFFKHPGVDPLGMVRALWSTVGAARIQGASTVTMQVADLVQDDVLSGKRKITKRSFVHKLRQMWGAIGLEARWSKDQILEAYLNLIHLKGEYQGVPAFSHAYLKKDPLALDVEEAAVIAALISSPNQGRATLSRRACHLRQRLESLQEDCGGTDRVVSALFAVRPNLPTSLGWAPHLARRLFESEARAPFVRSTVDAKLQRDVIGILEKNLQRLKGSNANDSAAIVIENRTGRVLAYVGAVETSKSPHVDGVRAYRQAGSSLKPFLYAKAIDFKLMTAASILLDEPTAISWGDDVYRPTNYDKHFYGAVSLREALGSSLNVPAVKTVTIIGLHRAYQTFQSLGLTKMKEPDFYGVSMALGAIEVRLDELANAYRILASGGELAPLVFTTNESVQGRQRIFGREASYIVSSILSDANARSIGFGWDSPLETPFWTAVKTGTSKDYRDNWCVGFSERYTVAVWTGNFDATAMNEVSGVSGAGPSWHEIMVRLHGSERSVPPRAPETVVARSVRHSWASHERTEYFVSGTEPASTVIEPAMEKRAQFVFPAEGSVLVRDPHLEASRIALFVRFKGSVPEESRLLWNRKDLGKAVSPFKLEAFETGEHELAIQTPDGKTLTSVRFKVRGA